MNAVTILRLSIDILTGRLLTLLSLGMTFGLACWAMSEPNVMREGMAGFFALCVFLPTLFKERTKGHDGQNNASPPANPG